MLSMAIGTPPQNFSMLVDTGSSNLAVAGSASAGASPYFRSSSSSSFSSTSNSAFSVSYIVGSWSANRVRDVVQVFGSGIGAAPVEFASIYSSANFYLTSSAIPFQGILGLGYRSIALPASNPVTPLFDTWVAAGAVANSFGMQLCDPSTKQTLGVVAVQPTPSYIDFGAGESDLADLSSGGFVYAPVVQATYYSVMVYDVALGGTSLGAACSLYNSPKPAIVDSGTTNLFLPQAAYSALTSMLSSRLIFSSENVRTQFFAGTVCLVFSSSLTASLPALTVTLAGASGSEFDLTIPAWRYLRVAQVNDTLPAGSECRVFGVVASCTTILGAVAMTGYTVLFDRANARVGFARSTCSNASGYGSVPPMAVRTAASTRASACATDTSICSTSGSSGSSVSAGVIAGSVVGGVMFVTLLLAVWLWFKKGGGPKVANAKPKVATGVV